MIRPTVIFAGAVIGLLVGLMGVGGGSLLTPMLILVFHVRAAGAIGTGVVWMGLTKLFGASRHYRLGTVNRQLVRFLCVGGIPGAVLGCSFNALLLRLYPTQADGILTHILGTVLMLAALLMYGQAIFKKVWDVERTRREWMGPRRKPLTIFIGFLGGVSMAVTSGGAGSLVIVLIVALYPLGTANIVGSDVLYGGVIATLAGILHLTFDNIDGLLLLNLLIGSLPGVYLGSTLCARLPDRILRPVVATMLLAAGAKMV